MSSGNLVVVFIFAAWQGRKFRCGALAEISLWRSEQNSRQLSRKQVGQDPRTNVVCNLVAASVPLFPAEPAPGRYCGAHIDVRYALSGVQ
jgi:hypothetical protein